jgi:uncharacterized membrane protein YciS (DUF1049 family)
MEIKQDFLNIMNYLVKSMIFICKHRKSLFINQKKYLRIVTINYIVAEEEYNVDTHVQIINMFFALESKTYCLESSFIISNFQNEILHEGFLSDNNNGNITYYFLTDVVSIPKKIKKKETNFRILIKSYLKVLLLKIITLPEDIINLILLYI